VATRPADGQLLFVGVLRLTLRVLYVYGLKRDDDAR